MEIEVKKIAPGQAAAAMQAAGLRAPLDSHTPDRIAAAGECFALKTSGGACAFVLRLDGPTLWIDGAGAADKSAGIVAAGLALAEQIAANAGCREIAFETARRGLVRESKKYGYEIAGYILRKKRK